MNLRERMMASKHLPDVQKVLILSAVKAPALNEAYWEDVASMVKPLGFDDIFVDEVRICAEAIRRSEGRVREW